MGNKVDFFDTINSTTEFIYDSFVHTPIEYKYEVRN